MRSYSTRISLASLPARVALAAALCAAGFLPAGTAFGQTSGTWTTAGTGTWSTTSNWSGGTVANGAGALANFGTVDLTANATITLDTNRTIGRLIFGDTVWTNSGFDWTLQSGTLTLDNTGGTGGNPPSITVLNRTTTISSVLAGSNGLSLALPWSNYDATRGTTNASSGMVVATTTGGLTFTGSNTLSGTLGVNGGTVRIGGSTGRFGSVTSLSITGNGSFFNGDATAASNNGVTNRIGDGTATLSLGGSGGAGTFTMAAPAASSTASQTFATLTVAPGASVVNSTATSSTGGVTNLIFTGTGGGGYVRQTNGIVSFTSGIGTATSSVVRVLGSGTVTMASTAGIQVGQQFTTTGFPAIAGNSTDGPVYVRQILSATSVLLSSTATSSGTASGTYWIASNNQTVQFTNAPTAAGGSSVAGSGTDAILTGAILNGTDFMAAVAGSGTAASYVTTLTAAKNVNVTGNLSTSGNTSINSLRLGDTTQRTVTIGSSDTLTIASGGILLPQGVMPTGLNHTITGGSLTSGTGDLWIYSASGVWLSGGPRGNSDPRSGQPIAATIASKITGSISVTVSGPADQSGQPGGLIVLSGSNDYTGGTFLTGGQVVIDADRRLGATTGAVTAVSGVNSVVPTASFTFDASRNFVINSGALLQIGDRGQTNTIAGQVSGGGILEIGYVSGGQRLILTGNNSSFTGQYLVNGYLQAAEGTGLSSNANLLFGGRGGNSLGILETSGTFSRSLGSGAGQVQWQDSAASYSNGGFAAVGGPLTVNLGGNATPTALTWGTGYFLQGGSQQLVFGSGSSTNDVTFQNPIALNNAVRTIRVSTANGTRAIMSGVLSGNASSGITKDDTGTLVLSGSNTYQGKTTIAQGTLSVATIGSVSGTGNLGAPTTAANATIDLGSGGSGGANNAGLTYTGSGETTDRVLNMLATIGQITLTQSGTGLLKFTSNVTSGAMRPTDASTALILAGSTSGTGEISGIIADTTMTGTVTLAASTGATTLTIPAGSLSVNAGWQRTNILVSGSGIAPGSRWTAFNQTTNVGTLNVATTADIAANQPITLTGVNSIQKTGTGTWVLSGNNTYTGPTTVSAGVLSVSSLANGGSSSNIGASTNAAGNLVLGGGSLQYTGATVTTDRAFTLTASTTSTIDVSTAGTTLTFTGSTTNTTGNLTKAGAGTLALAGAAAYTGATAINAGTLQIGNGSTTGGLSSSSAISIASGATLAFSRTDDYGGNFGNTITGSGALTLLSGSLTFSTAKTYTGPTTVSGGVLAAGIANAFGSSAPLAVNSGTVNLAGFSQSVGALSGSAGTLITTNNAAGTATLTTTFASGTSTFAGSIADNGSGLVALTKAGAGTQIFAGNNTYTGTTSVTAGTLQIGSGSTTGSLSSSSVITGSTGATLAFNRTDNYGGNVANTIGGGLGVSLLSGSLTLSATNTYTGDTSINSGRLEIASTGRLGGGTYAGAINNNGALVYSGTNAQTLSGLITGSGAFTNNAASVLTLSGTMSLSGASNAISNTSNNSNGRIDITGQLSTAPGSLLTLTVGATAGSIQLFGASNTIQGEVLVTGGSGAGSSLVWLNTSGVNSLSGATKITVASGNTLRYWSASVGAGTAFDLNGTGNGFRGALSFYDSGTSTLSGPVNLSGNSTIVSRNASLTLGGNITESGGARGLTITADGGGATTQVYTLSGSNSFTGGLNFNGNDSAGFSAKLVAGSATAFGSGPLALNSLTQATATAIVDLNGQAITVGGLSGGNLANANSFIQSDSGAAVLTVNQTTNDTFSGVIRNGSGSVALTKTGNATLTLAGSNSFSGNTRIGAGTLAITNANGLSNSTLDLNAADSGTVSFNQNSTLGGLTGSRNLDMGTRTLSIGNNSQSTTYSGALSNGALTKIGAGTLTLSGNNTFTGATAVNAGSLLVNGQLGNTAVTVNSGATLGGSGSISGPVTIAGGILSPGTSPGQLSLTSLLLDPASTVLMEITGTTVVTQYDQISLTGGLTYGGTLQLDLSGAFADNTAFNLFSGFTSASGNLAGISSIGSFYNGLLFTRTDNLWKSTAATNGQTLEFNQTTGTLVIVPEPGTLALAGLGIALAGWAVATRRRQQTP